MRNKKPTFLGIGAHRSATTWLTKMLRANPEIYLPPVKEIHFFDMSPHYPSPSINNRENDRFWTRIYGRYLSCLNPEIKSWFENYLFGKHDLDWYLSLFNGAENHTAIGEITPAYSMLEVSDISLIQNMNPNLKIIFLMRNPLERTWSAALHYLKLNNLELKSLSESEISRLLMESAQSRRSNYLATINNWMSIFPEEQFFFSYLDEVKKHPGELLSSVFDFLEVRDTLQGEIDFQEKVNSSYNDQLPEKHRAVLHQIFDDQIYALYGKLNNPIIKSWLDY